MTTTTTMIIGGDHARASPTVQIPPWDPLGDPTAAGVVHSPYSGVTSPTVGLNGNSNAREHYCGCCYDLTALRRYLPSNEPADADGEEFELHASCDEFRMYEFKVRRCARGRSHDWTECPYAHPGEKARRRDPRRFLYSGTACPDFRKGACKKGDSCEFAHGVFECWLHPERYRTQPCKDGQNCRRRVCFFAHSPDQLRVLSPRSTNSAAAEAEFGSPIRPGPTAAAAAFDSYFSKPGSFMSSPTSILTSPSISPPTDSPPMSPNRPAQIACGSPGSVGDLLTSMRNMQIGKMKMSPRGQIGSVFGSPLRPGCYASPFSPKTESPGYGLGGGLFDPWETHCEEEPAMERVESGRDLRAKIYAKLSRELSLERADVTASGPDVGWVSELVK